MVVVGLIKKFSTTHYKDVVKLEFRVTITTKLGCPVLWFFNKKIVNFSLLH